MRRTVRLEDITIHEISVVVPLRRRIESYRKAAKEDPGGLAALELGNVGSRLYVTGDLDLYYGMIEAGLAEAECEVIELSDEAELVVRHVRANKDPSGFNPLLLQAATEFLKGFGVEKAKAAGLFQVYGAGRKILDLPLEPDALRGLCGLCEFLAESLSGFMLPLYLPQKISRCEPAKQRLMTESVIRLVKSRPVTDSRFAWPTPEEIDILIDSTSGEKPSRSVVVIPDGEKPSRQAREQAGRIAQTAKDIVCIPRTTEHPAYVVDLKTRGVSIVDEKETVTLLREADSEKTFLFPPKAARSLGLSESVDVKMRVFGSAAVLIKYLQAAPKIRGVLFYRRGP